MSLLQYIVVCLRISQTGMVILVWISKEIGIFIQFDWEMSKGNRILLVLEILNHVILLAFFEFIPLAIYSTNTYRAGREPTDFVLPSLFNVILYSIKFIVSREVLYSLTSG